MRWVEWWLTRETALSLCGRGTRQCTNCMDTTIDLIRCNYIFQIQSIGSAHITLHTAVTPPPLCVKKIASEIKCMHIRMTWIFDVLCSEMKIHTHTNLLWWERVVALLCRDIDSCSVGRATNYAHYTRRLDPAPTPLQRVGAMARWKCDGKIQRLYMLVCVIA